MQTTPSQDQLNRIENELQHVKELLKLLVEKMARQEEKELDETPSEYLKKSLDQSEDDIKAGRISPGFKNLKDAMAWLNDPKARYENGNKVHETV